MGKNSWFKHYNTAHEGHTIRTLLDNQDHEAVSFFWVLHELISQFETEDARGRVTFSWRTLARAMDWKPSKCLRVLVRISSVSQLRFEPDTTEKPEGNVTVLSPNWLELQETRGGKREPKTDQKQTKNPTEVRSKSKEERNKNPFGDEVFENLYLTYPKRDGNTEKAVGLKRLREIVTTPEDLASVKAAIENYAAHCKTQGKVGTSYVLMFSTFFSPTKQPWKEFINYTKPEKEKSDYSFLEEVK